MKKFEYAYFTIYHYCSIFSYFPDSLHVRLKCMYLLALSAGGWLLFLQQMFLRFVRVEWFASHEGAMINALAIYGAITFLFYRIFILDGKDQKIYYKHESTFQENPNKKRDLVIIALIASLPYIAMIIMKVYMPRVVA